MTDVINSHGISLREFFERLLNDHAAAHREHQAAHDREHQASQKAIDTAAALAKENKADANEWRDAMTDRERTFARLETVESIDRRVRLMETQVMPPVVIDSLRERVVALEKVNAQMVGALNVARFVGFGGLLTAVGALVVVFVRGPV